MLVIGQITGAHGVRGEVKVFPLTDYPERFLDMKTVTIRQGSDVQQLSVEKVWKQNKHVIFLLEGIATRNQAEMLRGWQLVVDYDEAFPLPPGHYYDFQLTGMRVYNAQDGSLLGELAEVLHLPANAVYRVVSPQGREILVPALAKVVEKVDTDHGCMHVRPLEGMLDED